MIIKLPDGRYQLRSKNGRKVGTFDTKYQARKRQKQISKMAEEDIVVQEGYFSHLAAGEVYPVTKKIKLTDKEKEEKRKKMKNLEINS